MTKKDYIELAKIISRSKRYMELIPDLVGLKNSTHVISRELIIDLCEYLKKDNPNFNEVKFREACGEVNNNR